MKCITGKDLLKYIENRLEHLSLRTQKSILNEKPKNREKTRRMLMGRKRELIYLAKLIHYNQIEQQSKQLATLNYEEREKVKL